MRKLKKGITENIEIKIRDKEKNRKNDMVFNYISKEKTVKMIRYLKLVNYFNINIFP